MVNEESPAELFRDLRVFGGLALVLLGVATWELIVTFAFDWSIITGRRKWRWPMALYLVCRCVTILQTWALPIFASPLGEVNCEALDWIIKGSVTVGVSVAPLILSLRVYAVWEKDRRVGIVLLVLWITQLGILSYLISFHNTTWNPLLMACGSSRPAPVSMYITTYSYMMAFDMIVLILMIMRLRRHARSGGFGALLLKDGIFYFLASVIGNGTAIIFASMQSHPVMNIMGNSIAYAICTIAATRLFRHPFEDRDLLSDAANAASSRGATSSIVFRSERVARTNPNSETFILDELSIRQTVGAAGLSPDGIDLERDGDKKVPL